MRWLRAIAAAVRSGNAAPAAAGCAGGAERGWKGWLKTSSHTRSLALLREHLSREQCDQFNRHSYFDIVGSESGNRYRIHYARTANIDEYGQDNRHVRSWCFHPVDNLPIGDVLLAQKIALEVFEREALSVANCLPRHWHR